MSLRARGKVTQEKGGKSIRVRERSEDWEHEIKEEKKDGIELRE